jgi:hypothetical protein
MSLCGQLLLNALIATLIAVPRVRGTRGTARGSIGHPDSRRGRRRIRTAAEKDGPPRILLTPFIMGRPVGPVGDARTRRGVQQAALDMLKSAERPTVTRCQTS